MLRVARVTFGSTVAFAIVIAATGWLYLIQPHSALPGTAVPDALPLDELSRRSAAPLLVFLAVWLTAALLLGLVVRAIRAERLTAGVMLALGVGGWGYLVTGISLLIVRQVPAHDAFHAAAGKEAIYLPAALAGLAGALAGRARRSERPRSPLVLSWFVAAVGLLGVLDAVLPNTRKSLIASLAPERVHGISLALVAPLGLVLLVAARGLARRKRRAWQLAMFVLCGLVVLHLQHRFDYGALATGLVAVALLGRRSDFDAPGDPTAKPRILTHALVFAAAIFGYAGGTLWINRVVADQPYTFAFAFRETVRALAGLDVSGSAHISGEVGHWFPISVFLLEGRAIRKVRQSVHRLEHAGYRAEMFRPSDIDQPLREELQAIARAWRGDQPERGFVMALDALFRLEDEHALFVVGGAADGKPAGFLHFAVCRRGSALSLSSMPRLRSTPNGFNEWLVVEALEWARANGFERVSLNFAPFAALLAPEAELSPLQKLQRRALLRLKGHFQLDNLLLFNRKFFPTWQRRFVVYERRLDLPRVGIAALAAEAYLPAGPRRRR